MKDKDKLIKVLIRTLITLVMGLVSVFFGSEFLDSPYSAMDDAFNDMEEFEHVDFN